MSETTISTELLILHLKLRMAEVTGELSAHQCCRRNVIDELIDLQDYLETGSTKAVLTRSE